MTTHSIVDQCRFDHEWAEKGCATGRAMPLAECPFSMITRRLEPVSPGWCLLSFDHRKDDLPASGRPEWCPLDELGPVTVLTRAQHAQRETRRKQRRRKRHAGWEGGEP